MQKNTVGNLPEKKKEPTKKEEKLKKLEELNTLFKPVQPVQKVDAGVNPKSVLCAYFKQGLYHHSSHFSVILSVFLFRHMFKRGKV